MLNSVNVSANLVGQRVRELGVGDLESLNAIIAEHAHDLAGFLRDDPRGEHFQPFLDAVTKSISEGRAGLADELDALSQGIEHIRELINSQQAYAGGGRLIEPISLAEQVEQAVRITAQAVGPGAELEVVREFEPLPKVRADKHKVLEILVNLVQNARQATAEAGSGGALTLRIRRAEGDLARIEVEDRGVGIAPENLAKIFNHGFTTKKDGHGFGLHAAANAATELGGHLGARSDGPGEGATFVLDVPMEPETATSETA